MKRYLIWDFDGTLAHREGPWTSALVEVLRQGAPECSATADDLRPHLQGGYPWHKPHQAYPIRSADQWWEDLAPVFERAFTEIGVRATQAHGLARQVRGVYVAPEHWRLFGDTISTLEMLSARGWTHLVLSNHVPELGVLVRHLGLDGHIHRIFNSAETGYEKPHPLAYHGVLEYITSQGGAEAVWMIGDSLAADVVGAEAVGILAILVRRHHPEAIHYCENLTGVPAIVGDERGITRHERIGTGPDTRGV